jgi:putative two-component system response regulator
MRNAKILLIDDDEANVVLLQAIFDQAGFSNVNRELDARVLPHLLQTFKPDILLVDLHMPNLDGFAALNQARSTEEEYLPILVITVDDSSESKSKAYLAGASDYLTKPIDRSDVLIRTRNMLNVKFMHDAIGAQNQRFETVVTERTAALEEAHLEALQRMARTAEYRDDRTGDHIRRVGSLSADVARMLGLAAHNVEMIRIASQLHDIGKTAIPDAILLKPGKLTPEEFKTVKEHTQIGCDILGDSDTPLMQLAHTIVLTHHEWWNGDGYPQGIAGEEIPLAGRIVAVADVFDALTHERPYKSAWLVADALKEIERLSGSQFDPQVVKALKKVIGERRQTALAA